MNKSRKIVNQRLWRIFKEDKMFPSLPRNVIVAEVIRKITEFKANINKGVLIQLVRLSVKSMSF